MVRMHIVSFFLFDALLSGFLLFFLLRFPVLGFSSCVDGGFGFHFVGGSCFFWWRESGSRGEAFWVRCWKLGVGVGTVVGW